VRRLCIGKSRIPDAASLTPSALQADDGVASSGQMQRSIEAANQVQTLITSWTLGLAIGTALLLSAGAWSLMRRIPGTEPRFSTRPAGAKTCPSRSSRSHAKLTPAQPTRARTRTTARAKSFSRSTKRNKNSSILLKSKLERPAVAGV